MIRVQFYRMIKSIEFKMAFTLMLGWSVLSFFLVCKANAGEQYRIDYKYSLCFSGLSQLSILFPIILVTCIVLLVTSSVINDRKEHILSVLMVRKGFKEYLWGKLLVTLAASFLLVEIPLMINYALCFAFLPHNEFLPLWSGMAGKADILLGLGVQHKVLNPELPNLKLFLLSPDLYILMELLIILVFSLILAIFMLSIAFTLRIHKAVLVVLPAILVGLLMKYSGDLLNKAIDDSSITYVNYNLSAYFDPLGNGISGISYSGFFVILLFMLIASTVLLAMAARSSEKYMLE